MLGIDSANQLTCHIHSKNMLSYVMFFHGNMQSATNCKLLELIYFPNNTFKCLSVNLYVSEKDYPKILLLSTSFPNS